MRRRWCGDVWPTPAGAQQAGVPDRRLRRAVERALFLDRDDPVAAWGELHDIAGAADRAALAARASCASRPRAPTSRCASTAARGSTPTASATCPRARSSPARSRTPRRAIRYTVPSSPGGVPVEGIELRFARRPRGRGARRARRGRTCAPRSPPTTAPRRLGEIGIGTNFGIDRPVGMILLDEKIGGTVHLAVGRSYPETGGTNESAVHWDMICDLRQGGRLSADGEPILVDGGCQAVPRSARAARDRVLDGRQRADLVGDRLRRAAGAGIGEDMLDRRPEARRASPRRAGRPRGACGARRRARRRRPRARPPRR